MSLGLTGQAAAQSDRTVIRLCPFVCIDKEPAVQTIDSFCKAYEKVVRGASDSAALRGVQDTIRRRMARNEALYRCKCEGWTNPICEGL